MRTCTVCRHPEVEAINRMLLDNAPHRTIAHQYGLSRDAVRRHHHGHLPELLLKARDAAQEVQAGTLLDRLRALNREVADVLAEAKRTKNLDLVLRSIARAERQVELEAAMLAELPQDAPEAQGVDTEGEHFRQALFDAMAAWVKTMPRTLQQAIVTWLAVEREKRLTERVAAAEAKHRPPYTALLKPEPPLLDVGPTTSEGEGDGDGEQGWRPSAEEMAVLEKTAVTMDEYTDLWGLPEDDDTPEP